MLTATQPRSANRPVRDYQSNKYVYAGLAPRARGLFIGVNLNPARECNFACSYCEAPINPAGRSWIDLDLLAEELTEFLQTCFVPGFAESSEEMGLKFKQLAISGEGEPTLCPQFRESIETILQVRAVNRDSFYKVVLYTNGSNLHLPHVREALRLFTPADEIWIKLDAGTPAHFQLVNPSAQVPFQQILDNIVLTGRERPVVIQSCFPAINGCGPNEDQVLAYAACLNQLKEQGAEINRVQVYSSTRPAINQACTHLSLKTLSGIARNVRAATGLNVEVY